MIIMGVIYEREFMALFRARALATWAAVEPFAKRERVINPLVGPEFLTLLEAFAAKAATMSPDVGQRMLKKWLASPL